MVPGTQAVGVGRPFDMVDRFGSGDGNQAVRWAGRRSVRRHVRTVSGIHGGDHQPLGAGSDTAATKAYDLLFVIWSCVLTVVALRTCGVRATIDGFWGGVFVFRVGDRRNWRGDVCRQLGTGRPVFGVVGRPQRTRAEHGLAGIVSLHLVFDARRLRRVIGMAAAPVAALLVLLSGSRGAILALCFG